MHGTVLSVFHGGIFSYDVLLNAVQRHALHKRRSSYDYTKYDLNRKRSR